MNKLSHVFYCLLGCMIISCYQIKPENKEPKQYQQLEAVKLSEKDRRIKEVTHDGCTYLVFYDTNGASATGTYGGIVHKANCSNHTNIFEESKNL